MLFRLPLLLAFVLSLAFGPVQVAVACDLPAAQMGCGPCCAKPEMACCAAADQSAPAKTLDSVVPQFVDGNLFVSPHFVLIGLCPLPAAARPSFYQRQAARMPVAPRLDLTCIRLI